MFRFHPLPFQTPASIFLNMKSLYDLMNIMIDIKKKDSHPNCLSISINDKHISQYINRAISLYISITKLLLLNYHEGLRKFDSKYFDYSIDCIKYRHSLKQMDKHIHISWILWWEYPLLEFWWIMMELSFMKIPILYLLLKAISAN